MTGSLSLSDDACESSSSSSLGCLGLSGFIGCILIPSNCFICRRRLNDLILFLEDETIESSNGLRWSIMALIAFCLMSEFANILDTELEGFLEPRDEGSLGSDPPGPFAI